MDLVECEAPLDNSFQKDRRELVSKGSLGRRRKPSRSNLRLILSPSNDRQIIDVFHSYQQLDCDGGYIQEKSSPSKILTESTLDNHSKSVKIIQLEKEVTSNDKYFDKKTVSDNYREVVGSIKKFYSNNCFDLNGNSQRTVSSLCNRDNNISTKQEEKGRNNQQNSKLESKNKVNSKYHSQVTRSHQNGIQCDHEELNKLSNGHLPSKFNHHREPKSKDISEYNNYKKLSNGYFPDKYSDCEELGESKNQKISDDKKHRIVSNGHLHSKSEHYKGDLKNQKLCERKNHQEDVNSCKAQQFPKPHQNVITFSNHRQIVTSIPVQVTKSARANGTNQSNISRESSSKSYIEPSLPRTCKEPISLVEEARQFSVEAKLKRKNSDVQGRSAVLIRTWERRTQSESHSKSKTESKTVPKNRFSEKENWDSKPYAMPDSYICTKYKGSLQNGDNQQKGDLVSYVRDIRSDDSMVYREDGHRKTQPCNNNSVEVTINGNTHAEEPEWISLSRKLCAKFVEGHIEPNSPDSYPHEEPEGVGDDVTSSLQTKKSHSGTTSTIPTTETQKRKIAPATAPTEEVVTNGEPPWIHLSRKLCNKFIEEHIEYPPITNGHFVEVPELIEPNGDVRIIEKIGKPKGHKSKQKKECEPEWVSLSKKLRAKFIESHIDDPDAIALDNQLNASDPDETGSETLSDISQDTAISKDISSSLALTECRSYIAEDQYTRDESDVGQKIQRDEDENDRKNNKNIVFPEKECCWEYQEMEFDQESNSGNFQELDYENQLAEAARIQCIPFSSQDHFSKPEEKVTFSSSSSYFSQNFDCYNNDVKFSPYPDKNATISGSLQHNKLITVQFIAHTTSDQQDNFQEENVISNNDQSSKNESLFNFSSWEVAHFQDDEVDNRKSDDVSVQNDFLSDNLCDSLEVGDLSFEDKHTSPCSDQNFDFVEKSTSIPKILADKETNENFVNEMKMHFISGDTFVSNENISSNCTCENKIIKSKDSLVCANNFVLQKEKKRLYDEREIDSSSEDEVFESVSHKKEKSSSSSESNPSKSASSRESLKEEIQSSQYRKGSSPENSMKDIQFKQSIQTPPEDSMKIIQFKQCIQTPSPENSTKVIQFKQSTQTPSPKTSSRKTQSSQFRKTYSPENVKEEKFYNQSGEIFESKSLEKGVQCEQSTELLSSDDHENERQFYEEQNINKKVEYSHKPENDSSSKCNGMIPNSIYDAFLENKSYSPKYSENKNNVKNKSKEPVKMGMSKWITMSKSEQNINKPEYSNVQPIIDKEQKSPVKSLKNNSESTDRCKKVANANAKENETFENGKLKDSPRCDMSKSETYHYNNNHTVNENTEKFFITPKSSDLQAKCKSLCDISRIDNITSSDEAKFCKHESIADLSASPRTPNHHHEIEFQHFESDSEIPLCAKLVSSQNKRISRSIPSVTPSNRIESPCPSDSSHVYEDMFKETPSGPSDSEASWTVLKHNTYYVNGRSSSMNDLDFSDSCSMSMRCDYASSSESSTLQSRHSSYASSSFYVNLRDYDSHMLEPSLTKSKKSNENTESKKKSSGASKSSPPTPESLRHLFTSPLTSIHGPTHHNSRILNRMPSDAQSHYYSTAAATSSAFKHGFVPAPAKPKKTERSSSLKIKDIAQGIILTFKKLHTSKNSNMQHVDVSHLAEQKSNSDLAKGKKGMKDSKTKKNDKIHCKENGKNEFDSGFLSDVQRMKARRSSSDLTDWRSNSELFLSNKKKNKKKGGYKDKGKKNKSKDFESRTVPTVSRKVQQMADGTLYLVTTVSGDTTMPGVYSDSPDTSSELSGHRSVKTSGESIC